jgi:hypothetical protein
MPERKHPPNFPGYHPLMVMLYVFLALFGYVAWCDHGRGVRPLDRVEV